MYRILKGSLIYPHVATYVNVNVNFHEAISQAISQAPYVFCRTAPKARYTDTHKQQDREVLGTIIRAACCCMPDFLPHCCCNPFCTVMIAACMQGALIERHLLTCIRIALMCRIQTCLWLLCFVPAHVLKPRTSHECRSMITF